MGDREGVLVTTKGRRSQSESRAHLRLIDESTNPERKAVQLRLLHLPSRDGGTGRRSGLKIRRPLRPWGFDPPSRHQNISSGIYGLQRVQCFRAKSVPKLYPKCTQGSPHRHQNSPASRCKTQQHNAIVAAPTLAFKDLWEAGS